MSCGQACDGCNERAQHHLCPACANEDIDNLKKATREALSLKQQWAADADAKEALLQSVAKVCRGMKEPDQADLSVLGNVLRERHEARAEVERLRAALESIANPAAIGSAFHEEAVAIARRAL